MQDRWALFHIDKALNNTIFSSKNLQNPPDKKIQSSSTRTDITPFDRGRYLQPEVNTSFEDLNYQGEYAWTSRNDRQATYRAIKARKVLKNFFEKNKKKFTSEQEINKSTQPVNKSTSLVKNNFDVFQEKNSSNNNEIFDNFDDFEDLGESTGLGEAFFKLNDFLNKELRVNKVLAPILNASFSNQFLDDFSSKNWLEKTIKEKYYLNPVYKALLNADIDLFLRGATIFLFIKPPRRKRNCLKND